MDERNWGRERERERGRERERERDRERERLCIESPTLWIVIDSGGRCDTGAIRSER
jgi:hypothetical protein